MGIRCCQKVLVAYYGGLALLIGGLIILTFGVILIVVGLVNRKERSKLADDFYG
jgi:hypothetical protein